jgi:hypothetical protein
MAGIAARLGGVAVEEARADGMRLRLSTPGQVQAHAIKIILYFDDDDIIRHTMFTSRM